ncbi:PQQ-binding-like beta-propeller repeat protein [Streptomyces sp. MUM 203J]|uniref:protein kinase domain-containing protein n=1 Tax=Streptomyces sp. MUM 203J TaxID=2791990 RepID=UPI001F047949|nr:protein kinase [Streptomyces sp. MUM 203J]MCH0542959.1 PQQ-binding-like beta-propeller repeat protein [Streptomyces sp. MUM 203J]
MAVRQSGGGGEQGPEDLTVVLPATIGPYVVMRELGGGGMGVVSLCRMTSGRLVAVKRVREEYADDPAFRSRFRREVAAARRVSGVYTVPVVDADTEGPRPWIATSYVPAPSLDEAVRLCGSFREPALRALGTGLAEALQAVHAAGVVHRDVKPGNVLLSADGPRVIDFGIGKALDTAGTRLTRTGTVIGSPAFMAPEQIASSHDAGPEADVFALAGVLVYAACGEGPFGPGDAGSLQRIVTAEPDLHGAPEALHPLLLRCLDKTPSQRPSLEEILTGLTPADPRDLQIPALREELARRAEEAELLAVVPPPPGRPPGGTDPGKPSRRGLLIGGLAALGTVAAGSTAAAFLAGGTEDPPPGAGGGGEPLSRAVPTVRLTDPPEPLWSKAPPIAVTAPGLHCYERTLLLHDGGHGAVAFDTAKGKVRWHHGVLPAGGGSSWERSPVGLGGSVLGPVEGGILVSGMSRDLGSLGEGYLAVVDPATGREKSRAARDRSVMLSMLLAAHGNTAYCLADTFDGGLVPPSPGATPDYRYSQNAAAVDLSSGGIRWQMPVVANSLHGVRYAADRHGFYYTESSDKGLTVHAVDAARGRSRWSVKVPAAPDSALPPYMQSAGGQLVSSITAAGDLLLAVNIRGGLTAYDARAGTRRWSVSMAVASAPVVAGDLVLTHDTTRVHAVDLATGKVRWRVDSPLKLSPDLGFGQTLAASEDVTAVLLTPLDIDAGGVFAANGEAGALALRTSDGGQLWALREKPAPTPSPEPSGIGRGAPAGMELWGVAVRAGTVFLAGGGRVRAYRAAGG